MEKDPNRPRKAAIKWHGSKWRMATWIIKHLPDVHQHDIYVEPYGGSAAILLQKPRSRIEVYNDLDDDIFNFFWVLRNYPSMLIDHISNTPYHVKEWEAYEKPWEPVDEADHERHVWKPIEEARRFYAHAKCQSWDPPYHGAMAFADRKAYAPRAAHSHRPHKHSAKQTISTS